MRIASTSSCERRDRPSAHCDPIEPRRRPVRTRRAVAVVGERVQLPAHCLAQHRDERGLGHLGDPSDRDEAALAQPPRRDRPDAPQPLDRQGMEERPLLAGRDDEEPVGLRDAARDLGEELRAGDTDGEGQADLGRTSCRRRAAISAGVPVIRSRPRTSRNASSIESPSTSGDASSNRRYTSLLASAYADIRGRTTTACGHSRRAREPLIAEWIPYARAS